MPSNFDPACEQVKQLASDFKANEPFYLSPLYQEAEARCDGIDRQIDTLVYDLYSLTPAEIKIVEGASR